MIEIALRQAILANPEVVSYIGDRLYPVAVPEGAPYPLIVYERTSTTRSYTMQQSDGLCVATVDLKILMAPRAGVEQYHELKKLANYVRLAVDGFTQRSPQANSTGATRITYVMVANENDDVFAPAHAEGEDSLGVQLTLNVAYSEPVRSYL